MERLTHNLKERSNYDYRHYPWYWVGLRSKHDLIKGNASDILQGTV
jgi:hypothetical protein